MGTAHIYVESEGAGGTIQWSGGHIQREEKNRVGTGNPALAYQRNQSHHSPNIECEKRRLLVVFQPVDSNRKESISSFAEVVGKACSHCVQNSKKEAAINRSASSDPS